MDVNSREAGVWTINSISSGLPTGANLIGNVDISVWPGLATGANLIGNVDISVWPGLATGANTIGALGVGSANIGYVGYFDTSNNVVPTVNTSAYAVAQTIGGSMAFNVFRNTTQPGGQLNQISVSSKSGQTQVMTVFIFNRPLTASTNTDHVAFALGNNDLGSLVTAPFNLTPALSATGIGITQTFASKQFTIPLSVKSFESPANTYLYVVAVAQTAVTFPTTSDLTWTLSVSQD